MSSLLIETYRRPRRTKQNMDEGLHPLDEKRLLTQVKIKEMEKREEQIAVQMKKILHDKP